VKMHWHWDRVDRRLRRQKAQDYAQMLEQLNDTTLKFRSGVHSHHVKGNVRYQQLVFLAMLKYKFNPLRERRHDFIERVCADYDRDVVRYGDRSHLCARQRNKFMETGS
jgi:hypothetical protein